MKMWHKPWGMKEGFVIGGGLILAGLALELGVGPVKWAAFAWPVNGIVLIGFLLMILGLFLWRKRFYACQFISTYKAAIPASLYAVGLTLVMGLTRQVSLTPDPSPKGEGSLWINHMLNFWPFVLTYVYIAVILGLIILRRITHICNWRRDVPFLLNHLGLFLAMTTATLGNADMEQLKMVTSIGNPEWRALEESGAIKEMPFTIELKRFIMETYDNGSPKRFASEIKILTKSGKRIETTIDVNKPYEVDGWKIYQYSYDTQMGAQSQISILELVSDPWLPLVYIGFYMMLAGAVCLLVFSLPFAGSGGEGHWHYKWAFSFSTLVALVIIGVFLFRSGLHSKTLMPALQSPWFAPHVIVYMFAYALLGAATVMAFYLLIFKKTTVSDHAYGIIDRLVYIGLGFMTFGMLFGAFWAKEAWGHYWAWDPKETWAAITWLSYLVYIHYRLLPKHRPRHALGLLLICFILLQMCWWGINYLPSAQGASVHTY